MSLKQFYRFFIFVLLISLSPLQRAVYAQSFTQMMDFADEKIAEGDYYYGILYYQKAMAIDSNSVEVLWKYAEALRKYKDYEKALYYYTKVHSKEKSLIYPKSIFWLATMQTYNGQYDAALESWKQAKKVFKKDRKGYEYRKSQQGMSSCLWAQKAVLDTSDYHVKPLPQPVNSPDTELAPVVLGSQLWFTSLKADSINRNEQVFSTDYSLQIYTADQQDSMYNNITPLKGVKKDGFNAANGSISPDGKRFYFSQCNTDFRCKIMVGYIGANGIENVDSLGEVINSPNSVNTMPHSTMLDGQEVLFFASNRDKSVGGLDIWYSVVKNGNQYSNPRNIGRAVNTYDDEISPFYDTLTKRLYFSSSWHNGFGGQDIFYVTNDNLRFMDPVNLGLPINSAQNDTYFVIDQERETYLFSTNRTGVMASKSPNCCNDIYSARLPVIPPPSREETLADLNKRLPVTLYFHNDRPNPRSTDTISDLTYMQSYENYIELEQKYKNEYAKGLNGDKAEEAKEDIDDFFLQFVEQGLIDLNDFTRLLLVELEKGYSIEITVKGFASPLAETDYNVKLTKRRISSLINYLSELNDGAYLPYLNGTAENGAQLTFIKIPFGEYTANNLVSDNINDQKNSVYSRKAALERKIEIQSVQFAEPNTSFAEFKMDKEIHDFGKVQKGEQLTHTFTITNTGDQPLKIKDVKVECNCTNFELANTELAPGESTKLKVVIDSNILDGKVVKHVTLETNSAAGVKELTLTAEIF
jgi:hypothetical protein